LHDGRFSGPGKTLIFVSSYCRGSVRQVATPCDARELQDPCSRET
jgi:hypothetical protein